MRSSCLLILALISADCFGQNAIVEQLAVDKPVALWSFTDSLDDRHFSLTPVGNPDVASGPRPPELPLFGAQNKSCRLNGRSYLRIADPGQGSVFDFEKDDELTLEAWVAPERVQGYAYIIGKGRTYLPGMAKENHNWSLRLKKAGSSASISFLFRSAGEGGEYHRWESVDRFAVGDGWHHVAISYTFGKKGSIRGYIDGELTKGKWGIGGDTDRGPVVSDDEVWIGSAMGGNPGSSFVGRIDEVALHRRILAPGRIAERYKYNVATLPPVVVPPEQVVVEVLANVPSKNAWKFRSLKLADSFTSDVMAFPELPKLYNARGVHVSRPAPFLLRAHADVVLPAGKQRLLFRSREASRLFIDDKLVGETDFYAISGEANGPIWELDRSHAPNIRPLQRGDRQQLVEIEGDGRPHRLRFEVLVGLNNRRSEMGDASVSLAKPDGDFRLVGFGKQFDLTNAGWPEFREFERQRLIAANRSRRDKAAAAEHEYWASRHALASQAVASADRKGSIDAFVDEQLAAANVSPTSSINDLGFLRRLSLDTIGTVPSRSQIARFLKDPSETRRKRAVDRFLSDPGWADHWVGYWQDVLAENPNIVNPSLNNTGPFRWWIHESFLENKPFDRFVTELVMMEGARYEGGPAGFGMASENDVPMAAKSHVLGQAFLGVQMQCARCHDAPSHDVQQRDVFSMAAMLKRSAESVPLTSSIDLTPEELAKMEVKVTLKPGSKVQPHWSFSQLSSDDIPPGVMRNQKDTRERLAALITLPQNRRFAEVMVNRLWHRYLGRGLIGQVDDWEGSEASHPELLSWLADEFIGSGYDLKHIAKLIFNSRVYQRQLVEGNQQADLFAGPVQRRLSAEQLLDSLFVVSGKPYNAGVIAFDVDGARPATLSLNLGEPRRAWMFTSTSNERDRPGLALPFAEPFVTFLEQFGWRGARPNPISERPDDLTTLQPAEFANGVVARRTSRLSDDNVLSTIALREELSLEELTDELHLRFFTRQATRGEREVITNLLSRGFEGRLRLDEPIALPPSDRRGMISWSNHLEEEASTIKIELEQVVRKGDPPTRRLESDWRERLEDVIWSLMNSPEFRFSP